MLRATADIRKRTIVVSVKFTTIFMRRDWRFLHSHQISSKTKSRERIVRFKNSARTMVLCSLYSPRYILKSWLFAWVRPAEQVTLHHFYFQINVNGPSAHPLYKYLKRKTGSLEIRWNFNKILVVNGIPVRRYSADVDPSDMVPDLMKYLEPASDSAHEF